jgi:signal peptidase I
VDTTPVPHPSPALSRGRVAGALLVAGLLVVLVLLPSILGLHRHVVTDDTMAGDRDGGLARGSVALTRDVPARDLRVGDVITFRPPWDGVDAGDSGGVVTRRIVAIDAGVATTRADRNAVDDPWRLDVSRDTYPRVVTAVPWIGQPFSGEAGAGGWVVLALGAAASLAFAAIGPWRSLRQRRRATRVPAHGYF